MVRTYASSGAAEGAVEREKTFQARNLNSLVVGDKYSMNGSEYNGQADTTPFLFSYQGEKNVSPNHCMILSLPCLAGEFFLAEIYLFVVGVNHSLAIRRYGVGIHL